MTDTHKDNRDIDIKLLTEYRNGNLEAGNMLAQKYMRFLHFMVKKVPYSYDSDEYIAVGLVTLKKCINNYVIPEKEKLDTATTFASYLYRALLTSYWRVFKLSKKKHELNRCDELLAIIPAAQVNKMYLNFEDKKKKDKELLKKLLSTLSIKERRAIRKHFSNRVLLDKSEVESILKKIRENSSELNEKCKAS